MRLAGALVPLLALAACAAVAVGPQHTLSQGGVAAANAPGDPMVDACDSEIDCEAVDLGCCGYCGEVGAFNKAFARSKRRSLCPPTQEGEARIRCTRGLCYPPDVTCSDHRCTIDR